MTQTPPRWDLSNIYTSLSDPKLTSDLARIQSETETLVAYFESELLPLSNAASPAEALSRGLDTLVDRLNQILTTSSTIGAYLYGLTSTDSFDKDAEQFMSRFQISQLPLQNFWVRIQQWLGQLGSRLDAALALPGAAQDHAFFLRELAQESHFMMSEKEEILANELTLSGGSAWDNLQGVLTSQKVVPFEMEGETRQLSLPALINLRAHPDPDVRERAYKLEQTIWEDLKEPLAACLNGVKGESNTLNKKRGRTDCLHQSLDQARIDRETLDAMIEAIQDSLPMFRRYFRAKARILGQDQLPWWSIFAPISAEERTYTFDEARDFILTHFSSFSSELADFARQAFDQRWIDAEQRPGKRGGAYCMEINAVKESRVMCNFDGSLDQVVTIAHELGHGFHNHCAFQAGKTPLQTNTPMTLAETASIMCETIVYNALLKTAVDPLQERAMLEMSIANAGQTVVDIYSRFLFEKEIFRRRDQGVIPADEISEIMLQAQRDSYGDGLDPEVLNKFAWTWKPHYYSPQLAFYNYPYAFGLMFGLGLYAIYQERGSAFVQDYKALLASTGEAPAAELAARFGIDIRTKAFWQSSLDIVSKQVDRYTSI